MLDLLNEVQFDGEYRVLKYRHEDTVPYEVTPWVHNAITADGKALLLQRTMGRGTVASGGNGADPAAHPLGAGACIIVTDAGSTQWFRSSTPAAPYTVPDITLSGSPEVRWRWGDVSSNTYTPTQLKVRNINSDSNFYDFSLTNISFGTKPTYERWYYEYKLTLTKAPLSKITDLGIQQVLLHLCDYHPVAGAGTSASRQYWSTDVMFMEVYRPDGGGGYEYVNANADAIQHYPTPSEPYTTYRFVVVENTARWTWDYYRIGRWNSYLGQMVYLRDGTFGGYTQPQDTRVHFDWTIQFS